MATRGNDPTASDRVRQKERERQKSQAVRSAPLSVPLSAAVGCVRWTCFLVLDEVYDGLLQICGALQLWHSLHGEFQPMVVANP